MMLVPRKTIEELKRKFPSVYAIYFPTKGERITLLYLGGENEETKTEINNFLKEKISSSIQPYIIFSKTKLIPGVARSILNT